MKNWGKNILRLAFAVALVFGVYSLITTGMSRDTACAATIDSAKESQVINLVNQERASYGLTMLSADEELTEAANIRAQELVTLFSHTRPDGTLCFTVSPRVDGENIAYGSSTAAGVMNLWMNSDGHRANILTSTYRSIGVGCCYANGEYYWVQVFSRSTPTVYSGVDYSAVYDYDYYVSAYPDIKNAFGDDAYAALRHFVNYGMKEGRQAIAGFNVNTYKANYSDLQQAYGDNLQSYYLHYIRYGQSEGRDAAALLVKDTTDITVEYGKHYRIRNTLTWGMATIEFDYGRTTDEVLVGDWNGDGCDTLCVRRGKTYYFKNSLGDGAADKVLNYGRISDEVIAGDWNGDGVDTLCIRRGNTYYFKNSLTGGDADDVITYGRASDNVLVGDWNGDGKDTLCIRRANMCYFKNDNSSGDADEVITYGRSTDEILVGDWNNDNKDTLCARRDNVFFMKNDIAQGDADEVFTYGHSTDSAYSGDWDGDGIDTICLRGD